MKLEELHRAKNVLQVLFLLKLVKHCVTDFVRLEPIPVKLAQLAAKHVKIARLANTIMKWVNQLVKVAKLPNTIMKLENGLVNLVTPVCIPRKLENRHVYLAKQVGTTMKLADRLV